MYRPILLFTAILSFLPGVFAQSDGTVTPSNAPGSPSLVTRIPITLAMTRGSVNSISFGFELDGNSGAPAVASLAFQRDPAFPAPTTDNSFAPNKLSVVFFNLNTNVSTTAHLGDVIVTIPGAAAIGQSYTASVTAASGGSGNNTIPLTPGGPSVVSLNAAYLVSDPFPVTSDTVGGFGDGKIDILDLLYTLRAITNVVVVAPCSDLFDAMDSFPVDTTTGRGGDGILNTLDLLETLRRVAKTDRSTPMRAARGLTCPSAPPAAVEAEALRRPPREQSLWFGATEEVGDGVSRVPVYMRAGRTVALSFAVGIEGQGGPLRFIAGEVGAPSLQDNGVEGTLAVAWLEEFSGPAEGNVLLGYVQGSGTDPSTPFHLHFFGIDRIQ